MNGFLQKTLGITTNEAQDLINLLKTLDESSLKEYLSGLFTPTDYKKALELWNALGKSISMKKDQEEYFIAPKVVKKVVEKKKVLEKPKEEPSLKVKSLKERAPCSCQAKQHPLLTNCLFCGKIICMKEGPGPCFYCQTLVESRQQQLSLLRRIEASLISNENSLESPKVIADQSHLVKAQAQVQKLLERDSSHSKKVIHDLSTDYDDMGNVYNKWISPQERALALKKAQEKERLMQENKNKILLTIDLQDQVVMMEKKQVSLESVDDLDDALLQVEEVESSRKVTLDRIYENKNLSFKPKYVATKVVAS